MPNSAIWYTQLYPPYVFVIEVVPSVVYDLQLCPNTFTLYRGGMTTESNRGNTNVNACLLLNYLRKTLLWVYFTVYDWIIDFLRFPALLEHLPMLIHRINTLDWWWITEPKSAFLYTIYSKEYFLISDAILFLRILLQLNAIWFTLSFGNVYAFILLQVHCFITFLLLL